MIVVIITSILIIILLWYLSTTDIIDWFCSRIVRRSKSYHCRLRAKRLILIRHGQSAGNQDSRIYSEVPDHAIGLTDIGREQAHHCGDELKKIIGQDESLTFFVSPFRRSKETCELICQAFPDGKIIKVREDPRIREQEW
jgi:hypothetical protein